MTWHELCFQAGLVRLDIDVAEATMLELETRATTADGRAEGAWERFMALVRRSA